MFFFSLFDGSVCSVLLVCYDLPDLLFAEMKAPCRHDRALRAVRFDVFACLDSPVEKSRVDLPVMRIGEIRRRWFKERCPVGSSLTRLTVAGCAFVPEQIMSGTQLCSLLHQPFRHLSPGIVRKLLVASAQQQDGHRSER